MAFGIKRKELVNWKEKVTKGKIAFLTHYWQDPRFPGCYSVTKVGCSDIDKLIDWGKNYNLKEEWIDLKESFPHFDLFGDKQKEVLMNEGKWSHIHKFNL